MSAEYYAQATRSLPIRGAWIEMAHYGIGGNGEIRRSPSGERGLKYTHKGGCGKT